MCIPIERWVGDYFATRHSKLKSLEARMHALEQKSKYANHPSGPC
jgi:BMFP domain-containing protein YqiC